MEAPQRTFADSPPLCRLHGYLHYLSWCIINYFCITTYLFALVVTTIYVWLHWDDHLLNAYKRSGDKELFAEMVVRLFEQKVANGQT